MSAPLSGTPTSDEVSVNLALTLMNLARSPLRPPTCENPFLKTPVKTSGWENIDEKLICYLDSPNGRQKKFIKCAECSYMTVAPSHYFRHEIKHSKVMPFSCPLCSRRFQRRYKIREHLFKEHGLKIDDSLPTS